MKVMKTVLVLIMLGSVLGCANKQIANSDSISKAAQQAAGQVEQSLSEVIDDSTLALANAKNEGLAFYSPLHIEQAQSALANAKKANKPSMKAEKQEAAMVQAISVNKLLVSARTNKEKVQTLLAKSLEHKAVLEELGTDKVLPKEYEKGMGLLDAAIREVAGDDLKKVEKRQTDVLTYFNQIEADTLRTQWLDKAKLMLKQAKDVDAKDFAKKSYEQAERAYEAADSFIGTSFRNREQVKAVSAAAYSAAAKAYYIALEVKKIQGEDVKAVEQYMLSMQSLFDQINQRLGVENLSSYSFAEQARRLSEVTYQAPTESN